MPISEIELQAVIQLKSIDGLSQRKIAAEYGRPVTYGDIGRLLHGVFPKGAGKRLALDLPPVCPTCEQPIHRHRKVVPWVKEAADNLRRLEAAAGQPDKTRVYARNGKQVRQ